MKKIISLLALLASITAHGQAQIYGPANTMFGPLASCASAACVYQSISSLPAVDVSGAKITPTAAPTGLTAAALAAQQGVLVDAFKKTGDADDTQSFVRADAAGVAILLGPRTYTVNNFTTTTGNTFILKGVKGASIIQRSSASGAQWFDIQETTVYINGVIFDLNSGSVSANQHGVYLATGGQYVHVEDSVFEDNSGTYGYCLEIYSTGPAAGGWFNITGNSFTNCSGGGLYLASVINGTVSNNNVHDLPFGMLVRSNGAVSSTNLSENIVFANNLFTHVGSGLLMGSIGVPYVYGTPNASNMLAIGNSFIDGNSSYTGYYNLVMQGDHLSAISNHFSNSASSAYTFGAIDCNARYSLVQDNDVNLTSTSAGWGIDAGASVNTDVKDNTVTMGFGHGINIGASNNAVVSGNTINCSSTNGFIVCISALAGETDGNGNAFPTVSSNIQIIHNTINILSASNVQGINFYDNGCGFGTNTQPCEIIDNDFFTTVNTASNDIIWAGLANALQIQGNRHNGTTAVSQADNGFNNLVVPIVYDEVIDTSANSLNQIAPIQVSGHTSGTSVYTVWPTAGGSGYTAATTIGLGTCTGGTGFAATPYINQGAIIAVHVTNVGSGYTAGTCTASATDSGGGTGATFSLQQYPVVPYYKRLRVWTNGNSLTTASNPTITGQSGTITTSANYPLEFEANSAANGSPSAWQILNLPYVPTVYTASLAAATACGGTVATLTSYTALGGVAFQLNTGTAPGNACTITFSPAASHYWNCTQHDASGAATVQESGIPTTTTAVLTNYTSFNTAGSYNANHTILGVCTPY